MANAAGVSGPFNPAIGLGTTMGAAVIGYNTAGLATAIATWGNSALGDFIGQQSATTAGYSESHPPPNDFDSTFTVKSVAAGAAADTTYKASSSGFAFKTTP